MRLAFSDGGHASQKLRLEPVWMEPVWLELVWLELVWLKLVWLEQVAVGVGVVKAGAR